MVSASAIASPDPTAAPDMANAMAALLRERQISGQLPGLSGSVGPDGFVLPTPFNSHRIPVPNPQFH